MFVTPLQKHEMEKLLDKYESRKDYAQEKKANRRTMLNINPQDYPEYFHISDSSFRRNFNLELKDLESRGWVQLEWEKFECDETLKRIILIPQAVDAAYRGIGKENKKDQLQSLQNIAARWQQNAPEMLQSFYQAFLERISSLNSPPKVFASLKCQQDWEDFFKGLNNLCSLNKEIPQRRFSVKLYGDSKRWLKLCIFRSKPATDSGAKRALIPEQTGH